MSDIPSKNKSSNKPRVDVVQLVTRGLRIEVTISRNGGPGELVTPVGTDRLMIISNLIATGFELKTTGADPVGPQSVDTLVRIRPPAKVQ